MKDPVPPQLQNLIPWPKPFFEEGEVIDWQGLPCVVNEIFLNPNVLGIEGKRPLVYQLQKPEGHYEQERDRFFLVTEDDLMAEYQRAIEDDSGWQEPDLLIQEAIEAACYELGL